MNALALTGWIHTRQLLPVLGQEQTRLYDDETAISLAAGTPVYEVTQAQRRLLAVSIGQRPYLLGADAPIAFAYQPTSFPEAQRPRGPVPHLPPDAVLWLDGRPLLRAEHLPGMLRVVRDRRIYSGDHLMLALSDACARLVVRGHTQQMRRIRAEAVAPRLLGGLGASRDREGAVHLPAQTPLRWEDGEPAGVTRTYLVITGTPRDDPARVCFEEVLPGAQTICVLRASLESREEAP